MPKVSVEVLNRDIRVIGVHLGRNAQRPLDAIELLRGIADTIENTYADYKNILIEYHLQPFIIDEVVVDVYHGEAAIYFRVQDPDRLVDDEL